MRPDRHQAFQAELTAADHAADAGNLQTAFVHLQRAHVLGQRALTTHMQTHWRMLGLGLRLRDTREVIGQVVRMALVIPAHALGRLPAGNTGGADVPALQPMPIPTDLAHYFDTDSDPLT